MKPHTAKAEVPLRRQRTQYSCMSASMSACLNALGHTCTEDEVNEVMGARPMKGAAWEQALACAQHYGVRGTLVCPSTVPQLRTWTDAGKPVMIAWNPEGREWSHASVVFDVTDELPSPVPPECTVTGESGPWVWVADSNIPNPEKTVRIVCADVFYSKWFEKWPNYLVRRPALMLDREITPEGRQVMASTRTASWESERRYDKRQELRSELWEEDNPGLAAHIENKRKEKELRETQTNFIQSYFYNYALRGWATEQTDPEILSWVTKILAGKLRPWPSSLTNRLGKYMSPEAKKEITDFVESYPRGWGSDWKYSVAWWNGETHSPQKLFDALKKNIPARLVKYESLAKGFKPYIPPPNVRIPSAPVVKTVVDAATEEKIQILTGLSGKIQDPTIAQVLEAYKAGEKPTEDQLKKIRNLLYRSRMAPEADKFRVASVQRVVAMHLAKSPSQVVAPKDRNRETYKDPTKDRDRGAIGLIERGGAGAGKHRNKQDFDRGHARAPKHKGRGSEEGMEETTKLSRKSE